MGLRATDRDRDDPAVRAALRLARTQARDRRRRRAAVIVLWTLALLAPVLPEGDHGATVGAAILALLLVAIALAVRPVAWGPEEIRHRELEAIWRELRPDAAQALPWQRCAAWAEQHGEAVDLVLISCAPAAPRIAGAPSPYARRRIRRLDAEDVDAAAQAMEELRADAAERELRARRRIDQEHDVARRQAEDRALQEIDEAAAAELRAREQQLEQEAAAQAAAERRAQAAAVARALRRP